MLQTFAHYGIHFLGPLAIALLFFRKQWLKTYLIILAGILIDIDHILADPMFNPNRCSIIFHPLHSYYAITIYGILACLKPTRLLGLGLCIHILADYIDCLFM